MKSLLLFRRALSSPTMCRFIPALSDHESPRCFLLTPWDLFGVFFGFAGVWMACGCRCARGAPIGITLEAGRLEMAKLANKKKADFGRRRISIRL